MLNDALDTGLSQTAFEKGLKVLLPMGAKFA